MHYNFNKDLQDGQRAEREAIEKLQIHFPEISDFRQSNTKHYDIEGLMDGQPITFEVKNDLMAHQTGNVAIEYECRGKASGLATTTAIFWIYKFDNTFFLFETKVLRKRLFAEKKYFRKVTGGDKGSFTKMYLVKVVEFRTWGMELD